jgi:hypothetical protein
MLPNYSSFASFIPHLTYNDPDINVIFCLHLILLKLAEYFISINYDIMGYLHVSYHIIRIFQDKCRRTRTPCAEISMFDHKPNR